MIKYFTKIINKGFNILLILALFSSFVTVAQTTEIFTSNGTFTVPKGVTSITVECWGAGGGGASISNNIGGGGGGGGAYATSTLSVSSGNSFNIVVGIGGSPGTNGGSSSFDGTTVIAAGGFGSTNNTNIGGVGGSASTGTTTYNGGNGGNGLTYGFRNGGGGGGGAGSTGAGGDGGANIAGTGTAINGGNGGDGDGSNGFIYGGGGGGSKRNGIGGSGANGLVTLTYTIPDCPNSTAIAPTGIQIKCQDTSADVLTATITGSGGSGSYTPTYQWYYNTTNSNTITDATSVGGNSSTYTPPTTSSELGSRWYFCVGYTTDNTCAQTNADQSLASNAVEVTVNITSTNPTITLGSNPTICQGATSANLTYSATTENPDQYSINYDTTAEAEGFVDIVNATLPASPINLIVPIGAKVGTYNGYLSVKNSGTGQTSQDYLIHINIIASPDMPGTIFGQQTVQQNTSLIYSVFTVPNATTYNWTVPAGWTINSGNGTTEISVTTGSEGNNGDVTVNAQNTCGTSAASTLTVTVVANQPHIDCMGCHITHSALGSSLTASVANANLCMSCHNSTGSASSTAISLSDKAIPGTSGNSHAWDVNAVNLIYETVMPTDTDMAAITDAGKIICSTCHDQHNPNEFSKYLRISNIGDNICKDCHSPRNVGIYATDNINNRGSHPVGITYDGADDRFNGSPTNTTLISGNVECSSCHQIHFANTNDGNLLRMTNDENLCKDCHTYGDHQGFTCKDCHDTHNPNKSNILMVRNIVNGSTVNFTSQSGASYGDESSPQDGICEVCHTSTTYYLADGTGVSHNPGSNCITCHPHSSNFSPTGCHNCHLSPTYEYPLTGAHDIHVGRYNYDCGICHFGLDNTSPEHNDGTGDVIFEPGSLAFPFGADAGLIPTYDNATQTCENIYCHSDGRNAYEGARDGETWSSTTGSQSGTFASPVWTGSITTCIPCHLGVGNMNAPYTITIPGENIVDPPATGSHQRGVHQSNNQELSGNGWAKVNCFWCHNTAGGDDGSPINQGTYGTSLHVDGQTYFDPKSVVDGGTMVNNNSGGSFSYSKLGSSGHCGSGKTCW